MAGWLAGVALTVLGVLNPWFRTELSVQVNRAGGATISQSDVVAVQVWSVRSWGPLFLVAVTLVAALALAARLIRRPPARTGLAVGALVTAAAAVAALVGANSRFDDASAGLVDRWAELNRQLLPQGERGTDFILLLIGTEGFSLSILGAAVLTLVAVATLLPGRGAWISAAAAAVTIAASLVLPTVVAHGSTATGAREFRTHWPALSPTGLPALAALIVLAGLVAVALLRPPRAGRLPIMLLSLALAVGAAVLSAATNFAPERWVPSADRAEVTNFHREVGAAQPLLLLACGLLGTAAVLAWIRARRRNHPPTDQPPSGQWYGQPHPGPTRPQHLTSLQPHPAPPYPQHPAPPSVQPSVPSFVQPSALPQPQHPAPPYPHAAPPHSAPAPSGPYPPAPQGSWAPPTPPAGGQPPARPGPASD